MLSCRCSSILFTYPITWFFFYPAGFDLIVLWPPGKTAFSKLTTRLHTPLFACVAIKLIFTCACVAPGSVPQSWQGHALAMIILTPVSLGAVRYERLQSRWIKRKVAITAAGGSRQSIWNQQEMHVGSLDCVSINYKDKLFSKLSQQRMVWVWSPASIWAPS